jgi:tripartite ATP-independent transporter DctP family solute receptor
MSFTRTIARRSVLSAGLAALAAAATMAGAGSVGAAEQKVLRISTPGSPEEWQAKALQAFKTKLEELAPGQFDVQLHFNGTLFAQGTEIEAMQRGNLEGALISPQDIANYIPEYSIFTNGYLIRDAKHLDAVYDGEVGQEYIKRVEAEMDVHIVRSQYLGMRHVMLREPRDVMTPADLAGLKLRMPGSDTWQFLGNALGGNATPVAFEEVYLALQTGTIDGLEQPLSDAIAAKFYEVTKQVVLTGHMVSNVFFALAADFWNGLTDEQKAAIETAEAHAKALNDQGVLATEAEAVAFLEGKGLTVTTPDVPAFRDKVQKAFLESPFAENWPEGMLDRVNAAGN